MWDTPRTEVAVDEVESPLRTYDTLAAQKKGQVAQTWAWRVSYSSQTHKARFHFLAFRFEQTSHRKCLLA